MITQTVQHRDFSNVKWNSPDSKNDVLDPQFLIVFRAVPAALDGALLTHPCGFGVAVSDKKKASPYDLQFNRRLQNYYSVHDPDGGCRVMEASLKMGQDTQPYRIGFPLALLADPDAEHEFAVLFDGVYFQILCDGIVMDRDCPEGTPHHIYEHRAVCSAGSSAISGFRLANDLSGIRKTEREIRRDVPIQFYTPYGFNTWIGDVVTYYFRDRFHIFYLFDRRHHGSRRGKGAHEFWHMSSGDLKDWADHGPVFELEEQWQSVGTGNAFEFQGKLHLSFGWHTERAKPYPETANLLFHQNLLRDGHTGEFRYEELGALTPGGASYAVSDDGIHFTPSRRLMHYLENPSIFVQPDGRLHLCQDGVWESDHLGDWRPLDTAFPPHGKESFARNCLDCPAYFKFGGWEYFMVGFTGFWGRPDEPGAAWIDFTERGWDTYDGTCVPMVSPFRGGRAIEGGWLNGNGWGSCLLLREFVALGDGRLGKKWVAESLPEFGNPQAFDRRTAISPGGDTLLECSVDSADGRLSVLFEGDGVPCEFLLDLAEGHAQWSAVTDGKSPSARIPTFREQALAAPEKTAYNQFPNTPFFGRDFARGNLSGFHAPFRLRILIHADPKMNAAILDAEIAGTHTMASQRIDLFVSSVRVELFGGSGSVRNAFRQAVRSAGCSAES